MVSTARGRLLRAGFVTRSGGVPMIKKKKRLNLARETLVSLSAKELKEVQGGAVTMAGAACEPSGIRPCPGG